MELMFILKELSQKFEAYGFKVFAVGGTVRDYLLNKTILDFDFATDATFDDMKEFLDIRVDKFKEFGSVKAKFFGILIDITTFRKENKYLDKRHPSKVIFVKTIEEDYKRRDFTINGMYLDKHGKVFDFCKGKIDLKNKVIRTIGNSDERINEDPLRIIRAVRFKKTLGFELSDDLLLAIKNNLNLLENIKKNKIIEECHKMQITIDEMKEYLNKL